MSEREGDKPFSFGTEPRAAAPGGVRRPRGGGRRLLIAVLVAAALAGAGAYIWLEEPQIARKVLRGTPLEPPPTVTRAYKWRDASGSWQITDRPPPEGTAYETVTVRGDQNVLPLPPGLERR